MRFRHHDSLRVFCIVAQHGSFSAAAGALNLTKGAVSYQIKGLEDALGFAVFRRQPRGIVLTARGQALWHAARVAFDGVEQKISALQGPDVRSITIGLSTYFASRWLSPRLMLFMNAHPQVQLRLQPMVDLVDLRGTGVDLAIRWGRGDWTDLTVEPLFACPAFPTGSPLAARLIEARGLEAAFAEFTLLTDRDGSSAWADWHRCAGLPYRERAGVLTVPDPNVRVQAVIDGQGVALNDALVAPEIEAGSLARLSPYQLDDYGYFLAYPPGSTGNPDIANFIGWLLGQGV